MSEHEQPTQALEELIDLDPEPEKSMEILQCLVCFREIDTKIVQVPEIGKLPVEQLNDLVRVFEISVNQFDDIELPPKLFCDDCSGQILNAVELLRKIEVLLNEFKILKTGLKSNLLEKWIEKCDSSNKVDHVRKTLVQGLSNIEAKRIPTQLSVAREEDTELQGISGASIQLLYPSISLAHDELKNSGLPTTIEIVQSEDLAENPEEIFGGDLKDLGSGHPKRRKTDPQSAYQTSSSSGADKPLNLYFHDSEGKLIAFACPYCKRKFCREDYFTDSGSYIFKCYPECCDKVLDNFRNLVVHHEASCPSTPLNLYSKKRQARTDPAEMKAKIKIPPNRSESGTRLFDKNNKLIAFNCFHCERLITKEDYSTEEGGYEFKCFANCCDKVTDNFNNLVAHHESSCPSKPLQLQSKARRKNDKKSSGSKTTKNGSKTTGKKGGKSPSESNRIYDSTQKLIAFNCPYCKKTLSVDDFRGKGGKLVFKCLPECCGKIADNFSNLVAHHESFCPSKPMQLYSKRKQIKKKPGISKGADSKKLIPMNQGFKYNMAHFVIAFKCPRCDLEMFPDDFQTDKDKWLFKCPTDSCDKVTTTFVNLAYHHGVHCSKTKSSAKVSTLKGEEKKSFKNKTLTADDKKPFACTRCPKKYKELKALKFHMRLHYDDERMIKCSICRESFMGRSKLNEHKKTHDVSFKNCSECPKVFLSQRDLDDHILETHKSDSLEKSGQPQVEEQST